MGGYFLLIRSLSLDVYRCAAHSISLDVFTQMVHFPLVGVSTSSMQYFHLNGFPAMLHSVYLGV